MAVGLVAEQLYCAATGDLCRDWAQAEEWVHRELELAPEEITRIAGRIRTVLARL